MLNEPAPTTPISSTTCIWCGELLRWDATRGWVHMDGGAYTQYCKRCGWRGARYPSLTVCPMCWSPLHDDHCALPLQP